MKSKLFFIIIITLTLHLSCTQQYYSNRILEDYSTGFFNKDYDLFVKFPGDYKIYDSIQKVKTVDFAPIDKKLFQLIKHHFKSNILFIGKTIEPPFYKTIGVLEKKNTSFFNSPIFKEGLRDSLFVRKEQLQIDSTLYFSLYHITSSKTFKASSFEPSYKIIPHQNHEFKNIISTLNKVKFDSNKIQRVNYTKIKQYLKKGYYLKALNNLKQDYSTYYDLLDINEHSYNQAFSTLYSFIGENDKLYYYPVFKVSNKNPQLKNLTPDTFKPIDALQYLDSIVKTKQYILINEMHHYPHNRVFTSQFIDILTKNNFKHVLVEGVFYDSLINKTQYPTFHTGFYTLEPEYGNLLRNISTQNLTIHPYEDTISYKLKNRTLNSRDSIQFLNIQNTIAKYPHDKFLIYTGYDHINKKSKTPLKRLGQYLAENGFDIYCISQDKMNSFRNYTEYDSVIKTFHTKAPFVLLNKNTFIPYSNNPSQYDLEIFYPYEHDTEWTKKNKKSITINLNDFISLKKDHYYLIQIFDANIKYHSVPLTNKISWNQDELTLYIPKFIDQYYIVIKNKNDSTLYQSKLIIDSL